MATYYQDGGQEIQQEGLQTLYLLNPGYPSYADATNNPQQFLGIPQQPTASNPNIDFSSLQGFSFNAHPLLWGSAVPPQLGLRHQKGLFLSLSPQQTPYLPSPEMPSASSSATGLSNGLSGLQSFWHGSKYLKVAQQLLDEVVTVKGASLKISAESQLRSIKEAEAMEKHVAELIAVKGQELRMKNVKLVNMLKEVEQRYRQYHNQMKIVVSSFEAMAGIGAARTYTALALQTISKQFRGLRDAISVQIHATANKSLGEEGNLGDKFQSSRNQRSLHRIGMIQHNAWRPQRGLPERSVSILRAWLFEHFLHPYPKDSDKQMLAKQTGLTKSQVSNWFINARVRLWKPMVEDMYLEELKGGEQTNGYEKRSKLSNTNGESTSNSNVNQGINPERSEQTNQQTHSALQVIGQSKPNRVRSNGSNQSNTVQHTVNVEFGSKDMESQGYSLLTRKACNGGYSIEQLERLDAKQFTPRVMGKGVSLTLGLPNWDDLSLSRGHSSYLSADIIPSGRRAEIGRSINELCGLSSNPSVAHASNN